MPQDTLHIRDQLGEDPPGGNGHATRPSDGAHVSVEPNFTRRHHRVTVALYVIIDGRMYRTADWSLGGFRLTDYAGDVEPGTDAEGILVLPYADFRVHLPIQFRVARRQGAEIGCEFVNLGPVQHKALRHVLEAAIEGRLSDVGDALGTLTEPVAAPQLEQLLEEEDDQHLYVAGRRVIRMSVLYAAVGVLVLLLAAGLVYRNTFFVDEPNGLIMGNFIPVVAPVEGTLAAVHVQEGQFVQRGAALFDLDTTPRALAVESAQAALRTVRVQARAHRGRLDEERSRLSLYAEVTQRQVEMTEAAVRRLDAQVEKAEADRSRQQALFEQGVASKDAWEAAERDHRALVAERDEAVSKLALYRLNEGATGEGRFFGGSEIEGRLRDLEENVAVADAQVMEAEQRLAGALARLGQSHVVAPQDGYVYTVHRQPGEVLRSHDSVLSIRTTQGYWAVGRLKPDEASKVRPGQVVDVVIPPLNLRIRGVVAAIGHHGLSIAPDTSPDLESSLNEIPIKVVLPSVPADIPPGIRARLRIHRRQLWAGPGAETLAASHGVGAPPPALVTP